MISLNKLPQHVARFMPLHQQNLLLEPSIYKEHEDVIKRLEQEISEIPAQEQTFTEEQVAGKGNFHDCLMVSAHFFYAGCDWFILDWDRENDILYCYTILNADTQMSEIGTIYLSDLRDDGRIELDFYWTKCTLAQVLYAKYPKDFKRPYGLIRNAPFSEMSFADFFRELKEEFSSDFALFCRYYGRTESQMLRELDNRLSDQSDKNLSIAQSTLLIALKLLKPTLSENDYLEYLGYILNPKYSDPYRNEILFKRFDELLKNKPVEPDLLASGDWMPRALIILAACTDFHPGDIAGFVTDHWQNLRSDLENIQEFLKYMQNATNDLIGE